MYKSQKPLVSMTCLLEPLKSHSVVSRRLSPQVPSIKTALCLLSLLGRAQKSLHPEELKTLILQLTAHSPNEDRKE